MSVYKRFDGKRVKHGHKDYDKATWYVSKRIRGKLIHRALPEATSKKDAERLAEQIISHGGRSAMTFSEFADTIYSRYVQQHNKNTYVKDLFIKELKKFFGKYYMDVITAQMCRDYQAMRLRTPTRTGKRSNGSVNREMSTLSKMFTLACQEGILNDSPMRWVRKLKEAPPRRRRLTSEQIHSLENISDTLTRRIVRLAKNLPLRKAQVMAIEPDDISWQTATLRVVESKGKPARIVPLNDTALQTLRKLSDEGMLPFPLVDIRKRFKAAMIEIGINKENGTREENFHFHDLRHLFGTELKRRGVDSYHIQQLFAHSDMETSSIYISPEMDNLHRAVRTLDIQEFEGKM